MNTHTHKHKHTHTNTHTDIHTCTHRHTHLHTHTHTGRSNWVWQLSSLSRRRLLIIRWSCSGERSFATLSLLCWWPVMLLFYPLSFFKTHYQTPLPPTLAAARPTAPSVLRPRKRSSSSAPTSQASRYVCACACVYVFAWWVAVCVCVWLYACVCLSECFVVHVQAAAWCPLGLPAECFFNLRTHRRARVLVPNNEQNSIDLQSVFYNWHKMEGGMDKGETVCWSWCVNSSVGAHLCMHLCQLCMHEWFLTMVRAKDYINKHVLTRLGFEYGWEGAWYAMGVLFTPAPSGTLHYASIPAVLLNTGKDMHECVIHMYVCRSGDPMVWHITVCEGSWSSQSGSSRSWLELLIGWDVLSPHPVLGPAFKRCWRARWCKLVLQVPKCCYRVFCWCYQLINDGRLLCVPL